MSVVKDRATMTKPVELWEPLRELPHSHLANGSLPTAVPGTVLGASRDRLVGLVVKASASRAEDPGFKSRLRRDFSGVDSCQ